MNKVVEGWKEMSEKKREKKTMTVRCEGGCGKSKIVTLREGNNATWICPACASKQPRKQESKRGKLFQD